jgi:hypothetical protein
MTHPKRYERNSWSLNDILQSCQISGWTKRNTRHSFSGDSYSIEIRNWVLQNPNLYVVHFVIFSSLNIKPNAILTSRHCTLKALSIRMTSYGVNWNWTSKLRDCRSSDIRQSPELVRSGRTPACPEFYKPRRISFVLAKVLL